MYVFVFIFTVYFCRNDHQQCLHIYLIHHLRILSLDLCVVLCVNYLYFHPLKNYYYFVIKLVYILVIKIEKVANKESGFDEKWYSDELKQAKIDEFKAKYPQKHETYANRYLEKWVKQYQTEQINYEKYVLAPEDAKVDVISLYLRYVGINKVMYELQQKIPIPSGHPYIHCFMNRILLPTPDKLNDELRKLADENERLKILSPLMEEYCVSSESETEFSVYFKLFLYIFIYVCMCIFLSMFVCY